MSLKTLVKIANQDLLVLQEMEWNGFKYDLEKSKRLGDELLERAKGIDRALRDYFPSVPVNWSSPEHISACLYGGVIKVNVREPYEFRYKDGRVKIKERKVVKEYILPRLVEPVEGSALAKEGYWSTAQDVLSELYAAKRAKKIIALLTELSLIETKVSRYYHGIPKKYEEMGWQGDIIHGQLNQCVAKTSRLSSTAPNMQNMDGEAKVCFVSR
jgi:DNA polymerase I-like protein with 3'-5' exonuclease and polymerase domains